MSIMTSWENYPILQYSTCSIVLVYWSESAAGTWLVHSCLFSSKETSDLCVAEAARKRVGVVSRVHFSDWQEVPYCIRVNVKIRNGAWLTTQLSSTSPCRHRYGQSSSESRLKGRGEGVATSLNVGRPGWPPPWKMSTHMSTITSPGTVMAVLPQNNPALEALQTYKQRDLSKGTRRVLNLRDSRTDARHLYSRSEIQSGRKCSYYEAELLQDYSVKPLPGSRSIPTERAFLEGV